MLWPRPPSTPHSPSDEGETAQKDRSADTDHRTDDDLLVLVLQARVFRSAVSIEAWSADGGAGGHGRHHRARQHLRQGAASTGGDDGGHNLLRRALDGDGRRPGHTLRGGGG